MKILLLGATGFTGKSILEQGLARGHDVTALVRDPTKLGVEDPKLRKVKGDALDAASLKQALVGQDAVIDALGLGKGPQGQRGGGLKRGQATTFASDSAKVIVEAMQASGVKRLVAMSNVGAGSSKRHVPALVRKVIFPVFLPWLVAIIDDKDRMEPIVMKSGLEWTLARFPAIAGDEKKGKFRTAV